MAKCGMKTECYTRVTGYFRPFRKLKTSGKVVDGFNAGKMAEVKDRKMFNINDLQTKLIKSPNLDL